MSLSEPHSLTPLFPEIAPRDSGYLQLDALHSMYWEESGNPAGIPVVFLHGGPGAGAEAGGVKLVFAEQAWEDYLYWQKTDRQLLDRTNTLIKDIIRSPFAGIGKPEPLKHALSGYWSRRINDEHRIVYKIADGAVLIAQPRYHY